MKNLVICLSLFVSIFLSAFTVLADTNSAPASPAIMSAPSQSGWTPSITLKTEYDTKYLAFGSGAVLYGKQCIQSDLNLAFQNGLRVDLWNSTPFEAYNRDFGTEQDFGLQWVGQLSKLGLSGPLSALVLDVQATYFDEPGILTLGKKDVLYTHASLSKEVRWFTVTAEVEDYMVMPNSGYHGGDLFSLGISRKWSIFKARDGGDRVSAFTSVAFVYDNGGFGADDGFILRGFAELDWRLSSHLTAYGGVNYYIPFGVKDKRETDAAWRIGISYSF